MLAEKNNPKPTASGMAVTNMEQFIPRDVEAYRAKGAEKLEKRFVIEKFLCRDRYVYCRFLVNTKV